MAQRDTFFSPVTDVRDRLVRRPNVEHWGDAGATGTRSGSRAAALARVERWLRLTLALGLCVIVGRLFQLQMVTGATYRDQAERNRVRLERLQAPRGLILDRAGEPIVENTPNFSIAITPSDLPKDAAARGSALTHVGQLIGKSAGELEQALADSELGERESHVVAELLPYDQAIAASVALQDVPWASVIPQVSRQYHDAQVFAPIVGYLSKVGPEEIADADTYSHLDLVGRAGLERAYEATLRGVPGQRRVERNSSNEGQRVIAEQAPTPGIDLILGVDAGLQRALAEALQQSIATTHATGGAAVALDPRNGEIRALVSLPTFDPNAFLTGLTATQFEQLNSDPNYPFLNRAISAEYPSGSTIKPVYAAAALDAGVITPSTTVSSTGGIRVGQWFFPDWKAGGHGLVNLAEALADSVNTFFYYIGGGYGDFVGLGVRGLTSAAARFGLGEKLGIDLPGESAGFLPSPEWKDATKHEAWYIGDTYHLAIGQGDLLVTPLQIAVATSVVANGGTLYQPHLVTATRQGDQLAPVAPTVLNARVAAPSSLAAVRAGMREGVLSGSSVALASLPVQAAGKTGTAQVAGTDRTHAWFTAFAPYDDPQLVISVIVELGGEGHAAALPVAKAGFAYAFPSSTAAGQ